LPCIDDKKAISLVTLVENVLVFFSLGENHPFGDLLNFLIFKSGKKLMFCKALLSGFHFRFFQIFPNDRNVLRDVINKSGRFTSGIYEFGFMMPEA
jgi:hypothetical protein